MEALGINVPGLLAQIVNIGLLFMLLSKFAFKPILNMLDERAMRIKESLDAAERARQGATQAEANIQAQLDAARREGQVLIEQASKAAEMVRVEIEQTARREAEAIIERAKVDFELEKQKAIADLRGQFADLTILAAGKVINESLDTARHQRLIQEVLEQSRIN